MLESFLKVGNFYWKGDTFQPELDPFVVVDQREAITDLRGQFSLALKTSGDKVVLVRDRLGINKLFYAIHEEGTVVAANYLTDLLDMGVPSEAIQSVPAGHLVEIAPLRQTLRLNRYFNLEIGNSNGESSIETVASHIRQNLETWFSRLAEHFASRKICVCLSGGLDSGVIAALARNHFNDVTGYTYSYTDGYQGRSEDADYAQRLAEFLCIPFRFVPASSEDLLNAIDPALRYGQDWRDFNVHCAIVNELLATAIASDAQQIGLVERPLVLTGDLMNEFLADYTSIPYGGREYYTLPKLSMAHLRSVLVRGLDAGDREVGVFNHHGLDVIQPYGLLADDYLRAPNSLISLDRFKQKLVKEVAGDLLPSFLFDRGKVRAQIGNSAALTGILPVLVDSGRDARWMRRAFRDLMSLPSETFLDSFIRAGIYRFASQFPEGKGRTDGYYSA